MKESQGKLENISKFVLRGIFTALNAYIRNEKRYKIILENQKNKGKENQ